MNYLSPCGTGNIQGCWLDLDHLPHDIRQEARRAFDESKGELGQEFYFDFVGNHLAGSGEGKAAFPYKCWLELDPNGMSGTQWSNECTSWGARCNIEISRCVDIVVRAEPEQYIKRQTIAVLYGARGYGGNNGASPITIHRNATINGIALEQSYLDGKYDFTEYKEAHRLAIAFGRTGIPSDLKAITSQNRSEQYAVLRTPQELRDLLYNGNGIGVGHGACVSRKGGKDGISWIATVGSRCAHEECIIGYDDTRKYHRECLFVWDNSYDGMIDTSELPEEYKHNGKFPSGGYVLTETDTMRRVRNGNAVSNSMVKGFPARVLPPYATESVFK